MTRHEIGERLDDRVQDAIYRVVDMQLPDGSLGMWGPYTPAAEWLQAYVLDFLLRARDQSMAVPAASLQRGLTWLNRNVEKLALRLPEQYLWGYNRYKTPRGAPPPDPAA